MQNLTWNSSSTQERESVKPIKPDEQLWSEFQHGNEQAFALLYDRYFSLLYNYASKFTADKDLIKDAIHDLFIRLWERRNAEKEVSAPKFYLLRAIRHRVFNALAEKKKLVHAQEQLTEDRFEFVLPHESLLISHQISQEQQEHIVRALNSLTDRQKEAIFLRFYNNLSYEEIAAVMDVHVDSCYNLVSKALSLLKKNVVKVGLCLVVLNQCKLSFMLKSVV